jgi:hypothetical protein
LSLRDLGKARGEIVAVAGEEAGCPVAGGKGSISVDLELEQPAGAVERAIPALRQHETNGAGLHHPCGSVQRLEPGSNFASRRTAFL